MPRGSLLATFGGVLIPAAPLPHIAALQICPGYRRPIEPLDAVRFVAGQGLAGDRHARSGSKRQVLLVEAETLAALDLSPGQIKENVTVRALDLHRLGPGSRLRLGEEAELEITGYCAPCRRLEEIRPGLQRAIANRRGMLARVIRPGSVSVGDGVKVLHRTTHVRERPLPP